MTRSNRSSENSQAEGRVLIVDDEPDVCFLIASMLRPTRYQTAICHNLSECERQLDDFSPTHVILDINLPDGNGLDMLGTINNNFPGVNVIMHSALDTKENRNKAEQLGAAGFLKKPINRQLLFERLDLPSNPKK